MYIYEGNGPVASVPSQMRRCNTRRLANASYQIVIEGTRYSERLSPAIFLITGSNLLWLGSDPFDKPALPMPLS